VNPCASNVGAVGVGDDPDVRAAPLVEDAAVGEVAGSFVESARRDGAHGAPVGVHSQDLDRPGREWLDRLAQAGGRNWLRELQAIHVDPVALKLAH
jgi:hypothetical protein